MSGLGTTAAPAEHQVARPRILVVDDEPVLRELQRRMLAKMEVDVVLAADGVTARELLEGADVDAIVADVCMPGAMNGVALYQWVCRERPHLAARFLFLTGGMDDDLSAATAAAVLRKPFERDEYAARIRALLAAPPSVPNRL
jgi:two-component system OmpR family response regulator